MLGHRGSPQRARENTLEAFSLAREDGADGVELDVHRTRDGALVVHHDADVEGFGVLADADLAAIRAAFAWIPTLAEVLDVCRGLLVNIEIKNSPKDADFDPDETVAAGVVELLAARGGADRVLVSSFHLPSIDRVHALEPDDPDRLPDGHDAGSGRRLQVARRRRASGRSTRSSGSSPTRRAATVVGGAPAARGGGEHLDGERARRDRPAGRGRRRRDRHRRPGRRDRCARLIACMSARPPSAPRAPSPSVSAWVAVLLVPGVVADRDRARWVVSQPGGRRTAAAAAVVGSLRGRDRRRSGSSTRPLVAAGRRGARRRRHRRRGRRRSCVRDAASRAGGRAAPFSVGFANLYLDNPEPEAAARQLLDAAPTILVLTELTPRLLAAFDAAGGGTGIPHRVHRRPLHGEYEAGNLLGRAARAPPRCTRSVTSGSWRRT